MLVVGQSGSPVTEASDVYTVAAWLFEAHFGKPPVLLPGKERVDVPRVPFHDDGYSDRVTNVLRNCLTRDPLQRLSAAEMSIHPCFTKSLVVRCSPARALAAASAACFCRD